MDPFQILAACPHCKVEGAVVELYDPLEPCCALGVAAESRCRLCGRGTVGRATWGREQLGSVSMGDDACPECKVALDDAIRSSRRCHQCGFSAWDEETAAPVALVERAVVVEALARWAEEDGVGSWEELLASSFCAPTVEELMASLARGEAVETTFDVLGFLFSHMEGSGGGGGAALEAEGVVQGVNAAAALGDGPRGAPPTLRIKLPTARPASRRNRALALASVIAADGHARPAEVAFVNAVLAQEQQEALRPEEIQLLRPHEVGPVGSLKEREELCHLMVQLAYIDGERDETEMRVVRDFARAWGVDPARVDGWEAACEARGASRWQRTWQRARALFLL